MTGDLQELESRAHIARAEFSALRGRPRRRLRAISEAIQGIGHGAVAPPVDTRPDTFAPLAALNAALQIELETVRRAALNSRDEASRTRGANVRLARALARATAQVARAKEQAEASPEVPPDTTTDYAMWIARTQPSATTLRVFRDMATRPDGPVFSVILPVYKLPLDVLKETIASVKRQTYGRWELCIAHAVPEDLAVRGWLISLASQEERIKLVLLDENLGISGNSNAALELAAGDFAVLLDHDDIIAEHALSRFADELTEHPDTDLIYTDKDMTDEDGVDRIHPLFKPQWSPEALLTVNYVTHLNALRLTIVRDIGGWRSETDGAQDWDLFLRFTERTSRVTAIRDVLYRWRMISTSVASGGLSAKPYAARAQVRTLEQSLERRGVQCLFEFEDDGVTLRPRWATLPSTVSVIILGTFDEELARHAQLIATKCSARVHEVLVPSSLPLDALDVRVRRIPVASDASASSRLSAAFSHASADICIVIDAGTLPSDAPTWVEDLVGPLAISAVGMSTPKVLDGDRNVIARAGIVFNRTGEAADLFRGGGTRTYTPFGSAHWMRNVSAACGGIFAVRTQIARAIGFPEERDHPRADIDFCLRLGRAGWRIVYTPFVTANEYAEPCLAQSQGGFSGPALIRLIWRDGDPMFHPALMCDGPTMRFHLPETQRLAAYDYNAEANALTDFFDTDNSNRCSKATALPIAKWKNVMWVLPDFTHAYYGGIATILRFAAYLAEKRGVKSTFVVAGITPPDVLSRRISEAFPALDGADCRRVTNLAQMRDLPECDAAISTLWTTAYYTLYANARSRYYFVQDNEPQFYPAGTTSALAEATYRFGYTGICNTVTLANIVREYGAPAVYFTPSIDPAVFHQRGRKARLGPKRLFAYGRPGHARNGFELLASTLRKVKKHFGDEIDIVTAGASWSPTAFDLDGVVTNLGLLGYRATGDLYRNCDAGTVLMMTSHPSYLPMELMACGAAVITNENLRTAWLLQDGVNSYLAQTTPNAYARRIIEALEDDGGRQSITKRAADFVMTERSDWDGEWKRLLESL